MAYAACYDPRFAQSLPKGAAWTMAEGTIRTSTLLYRDQDGNECVVPNVWYNQPVEWRVSAMNFNADRYEENARRLAASHFEDERKWSPEQLAMAAKCRALAAEMSANRKAIC